MDAVADQRRFFKNNKSQQEQRKILVGNESWCWGGNKCVL